jgi:Short C-terminal domain/Bacterial PH domain
MSASDDTSKYASLLATGERVLLVRQRHWLTFLEAGRWFVLALGIGALVALLDQAVPDDGTLGFLGTTLSWGFGLFVLIGLAGVGWYYLVWRLERYLVTTRRVIETGGVINKYAKDTSLDAITDMIVGHPWLGRIVGYGEIDLLTASEAGTSKIRFLPDADGFKKSLLDAKHQHELEVGGGRVLQEAAALAPPTRDHGFSADELDSALSRLAELRDRGLLTQSEFDAKKRELLDRL